MAGSLRSFAIILVYEMMIFGLLVGCSTRWTLPSENIPIEEGTRHSEEIKMSVDELVLSFYEENKVVGVGVALVGGGEILYTAGYGWADLSQEAALKSETPMLLASVSKVFIATVAMQQVEKNQLDLNAPVSELVGFPVQSPYTDGTIALRHCLTHTSGIQDSIRYADSYEEGDPTISLHDFQRGYLIEDAAFWHPSNYARVEVGEKYSYSNVGSALAGLAIASSIDIEFAELLTDDVLVPLGMMNSSYYLSELEELVATPYRSALGGFIAYPQYGFPTYPDGSLRSSPDDMGNFVLTILSGGEHDGVRILEEEGVNAMFVEDSSVPEAGQGLIWYSDNLDDRDVWGHNGGDDGAMTDLKLDRNADVGVVILLNVTGNEKVSNNLSRLESELLDVAEEYVVGF